MERGLEPLPTMSVPPPFLFLELLLTVSLSTPLASLFLSLSLLPSSLSSLPSLPAHSLSLSLFLSLKVIFRKDVSEPIVVCEKKYNKKKGPLSFLKERIHEGYMQQWVIDNMPVTWCYKILESDKPSCTTRFPVGCYVTSSGQRHDACFLSVGCSLQCVCAILIGMHKHKFASHQPLVHVNYEVYRKAKAQQTNHVSIVHHLSPATKAIVHELCAVILAVTCLSSEREAFLWATHFYIPTVHAEAWLTAISYVHTYNNNWPWISSQLPNIPCIFAALNEKH